jgi:hypothetical protein
MEKSPGKRNRFILRNLTGKPKRRKSNLTTPQKQHRSSFQIVSSAGAKLIKKSYVKQMDLTNSNNEGGDNNDHDLENSSINWIDWEDDSSDDEEINIFKSDNYNFLESEPPIYSSSFIQEADQENFWKENHEIFEAGILNFKFGFEFSDHCNQCNGPTDEVFACQECRKRNICLSCYKVVNSF